MDNPHELPRPDDPIAQVHAFALDLAWGATQGMWSSGFRIARRASGTGRGEASGKEVWRTLSNNFIYEANLESYLRAKWFTFLAPSPDLMQSFDYVEFDPSRFIEGKPGGIGLPPVSSGYIEGQPVYLLTKRAFDLLEKPSISSIAPANSYDFMEQAEQLLAGKRPDHPHVPAAMVAGAMLERGLRHLCQRQTPPIETIKSNGEYKTLDPLINQLTGRGTLSKSQNKQLKVWADIRNHADHGWFEKVDRGQVEKMIPDIRDFLAEIE